MYRHESSDSEPSLPMARHLPFAAIKQTQDLCYVVHGVSTAIIRVANAAAQFVLRHTASSSCVDSATVRFLQNILWDHEAQLMLQCSNSQSGRMM